jgi:hypothetical protein
MDHTSYLAKKKPFGDGGTSDGTRRLECGEGDEGEGTEGRRRPVGSGGGLTGKRQRGHVGGAAHRGHQRNSWYNAPLGEVRGYEGMD